MAVTVRAEPARHGAPAAAAPDAAAPWTLPLAEVEAVLRGELFDPGLLDSPAHAAMRAELQALADERPQRRQFVKAFNAAWRAGPSSHVSLQATQGPAAAMAARLDHMIAGPEAVQLDWHGDVALLAVHTLMGRDTEAAIGAACQQIAARPARALAIDLRRNEGGAFAAAPRVGHLLAQPLDCGVFVSQRGLRSGPPTRSEVEQRAPWRGDSLIRFRTALQAETYTRSRLEPRAPRFDGPVFLLTRSRTASAAELAADALLAAGRARVLGERTAGRMLSQRPFDLPDGLLLFVPLADDHAWHSGRIEGRGVQPSRTLPASQALDAALAEATR